ncbi:DUF6191 domain-containing protein [Allokutzneria albata]|uniref:Uncharacterized protein n=1 Tax=Allokutzneria albata TaxID=211114 RepID=A0A1H0BLT9_ALLAB|nr:DUF6191 domain-containing protein [Allokutzneria albata]SDN46525.1 hypothetical protein SAMN04489726_6731 [Allokutzneria albata]
MEVLFALTLPGLAVLLVVLAALERFGLWARRRSLLPWRTRSTEAPSFAEVGFEEFGAAFDSGQRHKIDERNSQSMMRDDADDGAPPHSTVDLDAGVAVLRREPPDREATERGPER